MYKYVNYENLAYDGYLLNGLQIYVCWMWSNVIWNEEDTDAVFHKNQCKVQPCFHPY